MKFVRTKDGKISKVIHEDYGWEIPVYCDNDFGEKYVQEDDVLKQADTIEELCDWIVFKLNGKIKALYDNYDTAILCEGNHIAIYEDIYCAIETDKGLIYVAKMNENGELELL